MILLLTFLWQTLSRQTIYINKTIYLTQGEDYKVNLDSIFDENVEFTYRIISQSKGFTIDSSNLRLISDKGQYSIKPSNILRQRQLLNLEDYQGYGQFGILDKYEIGHRICYNSISTISFDKCFELDDTAYSYDFVFIEKDTIAVSKIRLSDKLFGVSIYQNQEIISDFYFIPSKTYGVLSQTQIEYCQFGAKKYLLYGIVEADSNIEFLEIQENYQIVNTNDFINKSLIPIGDQLQLLKMMGSTNKVIIVVKNQDQQIILTLYYNNKWTTISSNHTTSSLRGLEQGYNQIQSQLYQTILECEEDFYYVRLSNGEYFFNNLQKQVNVNAQVKYTLNYLIIFQENVLIISNLFKYNQKTHMIEGIILSIDVDFQNDQVFVFTDSKIFQYFLKPITLKFSSNIITDSLDLVTIQALSSNLEQIANIYFQVLAIDDYNLYQLQSLTNDLYYNKAYCSPYYNIPINGFSGPDIRVNAKVDNQVQITPHFYRKYVIDMDENQQIIQQSIMSDIYQLFIFRQFKDFSLEIFYCELEQNYCSRPKKRSFYTQKLYIQSSQIEKSYIYFALMNSDGRGIDIYSDYFGFESRITADYENIFVSMKVGTDRLFTYTIEDEIGFYYFPNGKLITKINLQQFGKPQGTISRNLWVNQAKSNLLIIQYGDDLLIGRFTQQFILNQRLNIQFVQDLAIISDDKIIVLYTDEINKLALFTIEDGFFQFSNDLDTHGFILQGKQLLTDYLNAKIMITSLKDQQRALLVFGVTELSRDSLLKVIQLTDSETIDSIISKEQNSLLLKGQGSSNFSIIEIAHSYQVVEINMGEIHNKFSQKLDIMYSFSNQFSPNTLQFVNLFYLEYQFYNLTTEQEPRNITYSNQNKLQIPIKEDTFQGQVTNYYLSSQDGHINLTTRIKKIKLLDGIPNNSSCVKLNRFQRILCKSYNQVTYHNQDGKLISLVYYWFGPSSFILNQEENYAMLFSFERLGLIKISNDEIILFSETQEIELIDISISIFYKGWYVNYDNDYLVYYQFQPQNVGTWFEKKYEYAIKGILQIQYDQENKQIFYNTGSEYLYYFESSLEGTTINKGPVQFIDLIAFLFTQKIYQLDTRIQNIQILNQSQKQFLFITTNYGNILNITILKEQFYANSVYISNIDTDDYASNIQVIDDYVMIQIGLRQFLYKNQNNWDSQIPNLSLEGNSHAYNFMALYKNGQKIYYIYQLFSDKIFYQAEIEDNIYLTINNLKTYTPGKIMVRAQNKFFQALIEFQTIEIESSEMSIWIWIWISAGIVAIIGIIAIIGGTVYCYKKRQTVDPLLR